MSVRAEKKFLDIPIRLLLHDLTTSRFLILSFFLSMAVSAFVLSSNPSFLASGDVSAYSSLGKEIVRNGFLIPSINTIHYPGSIWVYPPVVPYIFSIIVLFAGTGTSAYLSFSILGMILFSITAIPVYYVVRSLFSEESARFSSLLYAFYPPSLYTITWGGYPQLLGYFIMGWVLYFLIQFTRGNGNTARYVIIEGILLGILTLSHDLSSILVDSIFVVLIIYFIVRRIGYGSSEMRNLLFASGSFLLGSVATVIWYLPRLWWVIDSAFPSSSPVYLKYATSPSGPHSILSSIGADLSSLSQALNGLSVNLAILGVTLILVPIAILYLWKTRHSGEKFNMIQFFILIPLLVTLLEVNDNVLFARLSYFVAFFAFPVISYLAFSIISGKNSLFHSTGRDRYYLLNRLFSVLIFAVVMLNAVVAVGFSYDAHSYYSEGNIGNSGVVSMGNFFLTNTSHNETVAAPGNIGFFISAYAGNPVISYESYNYLTQPVEWEESHAAFVLIYQSYGNSTAVNRYVTEYNVSYVVIPSGIGLVNAGYSMVFNSSIYNVYLV